MEEFEKLASSGSLSGALALSAQWFMCSPSDMSATPKEKGKYNVLKKGELVDTYAIQVRARRFIFGYYRDAKREND